LYGPLKPSLIFYAKRQAIVIQSGEEEKIRPYLTRPGKTMILLPSRLKSKMPPEAKDFSVILERYGYSLLANEPMIKVHLRRCLVDWGILTADTMTTVGAKKE
jgi:hypothetical protein